MAAFEWLSVFRAPLRSRVLELFGKVAATDDGRRVLSDNLQGLTVPGRVPPAAPLPSLDYPLPLGRPLAGRTPVFVSGRFRSGSTLVWNLFRHVRSCRSFYEPLNERRWFDPDARGTRIDRTHLGVDDYWAEYEGLSHLGRHFRDDWTYRRLYLDRWDTEPDLVAYVQGLIDAAPNRAVLQFNRADFRLPFLRQHFPHARVIHLYRNPRDQWCSSLVKPAAFPKDASVATFRAHDHFYLLPWAEDLSRHFPFLDPRRARHPYETFYYVWRLSYDFGQAYSHASFGFEALCAAPAREIARLMAAADIEDFAIDDLIKLVAPVGSGKWTQYADASWFEAHEQHCEDVLARVYREPMRD